MPCHPDYFSVTELAKEIGKVYHLLDELDGKPLDTKCWASGSHEKVTDKNLNRKHFIEVTQLLCQRLRGLESTDEYSIELNRWWNGHKREDRSRLQLALYQAEDKEEFMSKLSEYERKLLE